MLNKMKNKMTTTGFKMASSLKSAIMHRKRRQIVHNKNDAECVPASGFSSSRRGALFALAGAPIIAPLAAKAIAEQALSKGIPGSSFGALAGVKKVTDALSVDTEPSEDCFESTTEYSPDGLSQWDVFRFIKSREEQNFILEEITANGFPDHWLREAYNDAIFRARDYLPHNIACLRSVTPQAKFHQAVKHYMIENLVDKLNQNRYEQYDFDWSMKRKNSLRGRIMNLAFDSNPMLSWFKSSINKSQGLGEYLRNQL